MPTTRLAYRLTAGSRADLVAREEALGPPGRGEVQIAVRAIGLNFADVFSVWGLYSATPAGAFVPGLEVAGDVVAAGADAPHAVGDRVYGVTRFGAYATLVNLDHRYALPLPAGWSYAEGAAYPVQALTAYYGLVALGGLRPGHTVLVHSAAGGVGVWAGRICRHFGATAVGTVGRAAKVAFAKTQGYAEVVVRGPASGLRAQFAFAAQAAHGAPPPPPLARRRGRTVAEPCYDLVMEPTGGRVQAASWSLVLPEGRMVVYGSAHFASPSARPNKLRLLWKYLRRPRIDPQAMIAENRGVLAFNLIWLYGQTDKMRALLAELAALDLGRPHIGHAFAFDRLPAAVAALQSGATVGKVVVEIGSHA